MPEQQEQMQEEQHKLSLKLLERRAVESPGHQLILALAAGEHLSTQEWNARLKHIGGSLTERDYTSLKKAVWGNVIYTEDRWSDIAVTDSDVEAMQWAIHQMNEKVVGFGEDILTSDPDCKSLMDFFRGVRSLIPKERPKMTYPSANIVANSIMTSKYGAQWTGDLQRQREQNQILLSKLDDDDYLRPERITIESIQRLYAMLETMEKKVFETLQAKKLENGIPLMWNDSETGGDVSNYYIEPEGFTKPKDFTTKWKVPGSVLTDARHQQFTLFSDTVNPQTGAPLHLTLGASSHIENAWEKPNEPYADRLRRITAYEAYKQLYERLNYVMNDIDDVLKAGSIDKNRVLRNVENLYSIPSTYVRGTMMQEMIMRESGDLRQHDINGRYLFNTLFFRSLEEGKAVEMDHSRPIKNFFSGLFSMEGGGAMASAMETWKATAIPVALAESGAREMGKMANVMMDQARTLMKPYIMIQGNPLLDMKYLSSITEVSTYPLEKELPFVPYQFPEPAERHIFIRSVADATPNVMHGYLPLYTNEYAKVAEISITCGGEVLVLNEDFTLEYEQETGHYRAQFHTSGLQKVAEHGIDEYRIGIVPNELAAEATPLEPFVLIENLDALDGYAATLEERGDTQIARNIRKATKKARDQGRSLKSSELEAAFIAGSRYGFNRARVADYYREQNGEITPAPDADGTTVAQCSHAANLFAECIQSCLPEATVRPTGHLAAINMGMGYVFAGSPHADVRGEIDGVRFRHDPTPTPKMRSLLELIPQSQKAKDKQKEADVAAKRERLNIPVIEKTISLEMATKELDQTLATYDAAILRVTPLTKTGKHDISSYPQTMAQWRATLGTISGSLPRLYLEPQTRPDAIDQIKKIQADIALFNHALADDQDLRRREMTHKVFGVYGVVLGDLYTQLNFVASTIAKL